MNKQIYPSAKRVGLVFAGFTAAFIISMAGVFFENQKTHELTKKITLPTQKMLKKISSELSKISKPTVQVNTDSKINSSVSVEINTNSSSDSGENNNQYKKTENQYQQTSNSNVQIHWNTPTADPTTIEWQRQFNAEYEKIKNQTVNWSTPTPNLSTVQWQKEFDAKWAEINSNFEKTKADYCQKVPDSISCK